MSNEINIEELERLAKAAAPGPWRRQDFHSSSEKNGIDDSDGDVVCASYGRLRPKSFDFIAAANPSAVLSLVDRLKKAEAELERERMRLTACGVVALADTPESAAKAREMRDEYRSASCDDVARRVDECMTLRAERDALEVVSTHEGPYNFEGMALLGKGTHHLYARPVPAEPVNVDFGKRGENMFFNIGNQSFLLDYKPEEQDEFDFMKTMLLSAFSRITHGVKTESRPVNARLLDVATGKTPHLYAGRCPDSVNGPEPRDPDCPACQAIVSADAQQGRLLQDMHDAGREIDRVMDEAAPKAVRLTDEEVDICFDGSDGTRIGAARAIEAAALRKNGIEVAE